MQYLSINPMNFTNDGDRIVLFLSIEVV